MMRAMVVEGGALVASRSVPKPKPGIGQVLIRVAAAGVNRPDILQRQGKYPAPPGASPLLGLEVSGTIAEVGSSVDSRLQVGQPVCALTNGGGYAEYVAVPQGHVLPVPKKYSMIEAAAFPETVFTVWHNVFQPDILPHGATILVHGGTSGIGSTALQLGSALGYRMYATSGSAEKCHAAMKFGATVAFNYNTEDWAAKMRDAGGAFFVLDMVGGPYFQRNLEVLQTGGRLAIIAFLGGAKTEANLMRIMLKRLTVTGSTLRSQSDAEKAAICSQVRDKVIPLAEERKLVPPIHQTLPLEEAAQAHDMLEAGKVIGKLVLTLT